MKDLNMKKSGMRETEEPPLCTVIGAVIVIGFWLAWAFCIGGML